MPKFSKNYMILRLAPLDLLKFYFRTIVTRINEKIYAMNKRENPLTSINRLHTISQWQRNVSPKITRNIGVPTNTMGMAKSEAKS